MNFDGTSTTHVTPQILGFDMRLSHPRQYVSSVDLLPKKSNHKSLFHVTLLAGQQKTSVHGELDPSRLYWNLKLVFIQVIAIQYQVCILAL